MCKPAKIKFIEATFPNMVNDKGINVSIKADNVTTPPTLSIDINSGSTDTVFNYVHTHPDEVTWVNALTQIEIVSSLAISRPERIRIVEYLKTLLKGRVSKVVADSVDIRCIQFSYGGDYPAIYELDIEFPNTNSAGLTVRRYEMGSGLGPETHTYVVLCDKWINWKKVIQLLEDMERPFEGEDKQRIISHLKGISGLHEDSTSLPGIGPWTK